MGLYFIRPPFAVHLEWFENVKQADGKSRRVRREKAFFHGEEPVELSDLDAVAHRHKLEPANESAEKHFNALIEHEAAAKAARDPAPIAGHSLAEVKNAVIAELVAAGVIKQPKNAGL